jgi:hypothetical protein
LVLQGAELPIRLLVVPFGRMLNSSSQGVTTSHY